jgi:hypothetical protein
MRSAVLERIDPRYTFSRRIEAELDLLSRPATTPGHYSVAADTRRIWGSVTG